VQHLTEFEGKRLINASREGLKLEEGDADKKREDKYKEMFKPLTDYMKEVRVWPFIRWFIICIINIIFCTLTCTKRWSNAARLHEGGARSAFYIVYHVLSRVRVWVNP